MLKEFSFGTVQPGESLEYGYNYFATASTGFGETAVFAAIGDPFDLTFSGGSFSVQFDDVDVPGTSVPEPGTLALMTLGLASTGFLRRRWQKTLKQEIRRTGDLKPFLVSQHLHRIDATGPSRGDDRREGGDRSQHERHEDKRQRIAHGDAEH